MAMSRKDYVAIADILATTIIDFQAGARLANRLADVFAEDNPRFDRERFLAACELSDITAEPV